MAATTINAAQDPAAVWDCGQRHTGRPRRLLGVLLVLLSLNVGSVALLPFLNANSDDPVAAWMAMAALLAITLKLAATGLLRESVHLERVMPGRSGVLIIGARLAHLGAVYQPVEVLVPWAAVAALEIDEIGETHNRGATVGIGLEMATGFGRRIRLVFASHERAQAFCARALALRSGAAPVSPTGS